MTLPVSRDDRDYQSYRETEFGSSRAVSIEADTFQRDAYGGLEVTNNTPFIAGNAVYGFIPVNFREYSLGNGSTGVNENVMTVSSGTSLGTYGAIRSFRSLNYKTGQGAVVRFGARFIDPVANSWTGAGAFNIGDEFSFGYNGTSFGIWHRYNSRAEVQRLTMDVAASGAETATVTIDNTSYSIPLTAGTTQFNAAQIATYLNVNSTIVEAEQLDSTVIINFLSDGDKTGTFSFSSTGTATGTFTQLTQGVTKTSVHVPKENWDCQGGLTTFDSNDFDPSKGNAYQIVFANGYGDAKFFIYCSITGAYIQVHQIRWINNNTTTNLLNPSLHVGCYATALGSIVATSVEAPYFSGFINGIIQNIRNPRAYENTKSIGTTNTNILTVRCSRTCNSKSNQVEIDPVYLTLANDGAKSAVFELRTGATVTGQIFQTLGNNLVSQYDTTGSTLSGGTLAAAFVVAKGQSINIDLKEFEIRVPPSLTLTISGRMASGAAADLSAALTWYEDI